MAAPSVPTLSSRLCMSEQSVWPPKPLRPTVMPGNPRDVQEIAKFAESAHHRSM